MANDACATSVWINYSPTLLDDATKNAVNTKSVTIDHQLYGLLQLPDVVRNCEAVGQKVVGVLLSKAHKKADQIAMGCFRDTSTIRYRGIEIFADIEAQGPFDVIVHKITELSNTADPANKDAVDRFVHYCEAHPEVQILDGLQVIEYCLCRHKFMAAFAEHFGEFIMSDSGIKLRLPWSINVDGTLADVECSRFPMLLKAKQATNSVESHLHTIVFNPEGFAEVQGLYQNGSVLQEFVNHDGVVYKVYFCDHHYFYESKPSVANLSNCGVNYTQFTNVSFPKEILSDEKPIYRELDPVSV
jgi:inositol-1,3,4-trisphosphate 5/6-kinase/inositol-tetrakisphosphate 1-kinase